MADAMQPIVSINSLGNLHSFIKHWRHFGCLSDIFCIISPMVGQPLEVWHFRAHENIRIGLNRLIWLPSANNKHFSCQTTKLFNKYSSELMVSLNVFQYPSNSVDKAAMYHTA